MLSTLIDVSAAVARRLLIVATLTLIGLVVGAGCVIFPSTIPWAILGVCGLLLLWVMPDLHTVPERLATLIILPFIVSILAVPSYYGVILPGLPWISIRRVVFGLFAFAVIVTLSGSAKQRSEVWRKVRATPFISVPLAAYFVLIVLSAVVATRPGVAIQNALNELLFELLPFVGAVLIVRSEKQLYRIFAVFLVCVVSDLAIGFTEYRLHHPFLIYALPESMRNQILQSPGLVGLVEGGAMRGGVVRPFSVYTTALSWGEMSAMMAPVGAFFVAFGRNLWIRFLGLAAMGACFGCVFLSGSRGAFVGFIAGLLVFTGLYVFWLAREKSRTLIPHLALVVCIIVAITTLSSVLFVGRVHKAVLGGAETAGSTDARGEQWALAKPKILARPLLGYGTGLAAETVGWTSGKLLSLDSYVISLLVGVGIPGCLAFFAMLIAAIVRASTSFVLSRASASKCGAALGCCLIPYTIYRTTLSQAENNTLVFIIIGLVVCLADMTRRRVQPSNGAMDRADNNAASRMDRNALHRR